MRRALQIPPVFGAILATLVIFAGCASINSVRYRKYPRNPRPEYRKIAILPFINYTDETVDGEKVAHIFASQLTRFPGYDIIRPQLLEETRKKNKLEISSPDEAIQCAKILGADAVLVGAITDYKPYYPPRIGMAIQVFVVKRPLETSLDIEKLMQSGKPFSLTENDGNRTLAVLDRVYDGEDNTVRDMVRAYGLVHGTREDFDPEETFLRVTDKFIEFVSDEMIRGMISFCEMREVRERKERETHEEDTEEPDTEAPSCDRQGE